MRTIIQRVSNAKVRVDEQEIDAIHQGLLLLVGIHQKDTEEQLYWMCEKILKVRIFVDEEGKMNKSVMDINGEILVVPQFTLYGDVKKGTRPSYIEAARPEKAKPMYEAMIHYLKNNSQLVVKKGKFGASMDVELVNKGPVTLILEK
jgi:D-tyrosyl-tRNA(Tyr) deacylase